MDPVLEYAARIAYSTRETLQFTYEMAVKYKDSPGVYVECGVAAGAQIIAMAHGAPDKKIYAFDSFQGIALPSNRDDQMPGLRMLSEEEIRELPAPGKQELKSSGATVVSEKDFWLHIYAALGSMRKIYTRPGWFEETVKEFSEPISILRLDGDLYNSTLVCLENLFPLVNKGGVVIIDDWQLKGCRNALINYFCDIDRYGREEIAERLIKMEYVSNIAYFIK